MTRAALRRQIRGPAVQARRDKRAARFRRLRARAKELYRAASEACTWWDYPKTDYEDKEQRRIAATIGDKIYSYVFKTA